MPFSKLLPPWVAPASLQGGTEDASSVLRANILEASVTVY